jgi:hypothetical protein
MTGIKLFVAMVIASLISGLAYMAVVSRQAALGGPPVFQSHNEALQREMEMTSRDVNGQRR